MNKIYIVDDEVKMLKILEMNLKDLGETLIFSEPLKALESLKNLHDKGDSPSILMTDIKMPNMTGDELMMEARKLFPTLPVIIMTAYGTIEKAVNMMKAGATDYLVKPLNIECVMSLINRFLAGPQDSNICFSGIISQNTAMHSLFNSIRMVATEKISVLIQGESGTGKELIARALHNNSPRCCERFVPVNCAAIPSELLESELFGYVTGAFTSADKDKEGKFLAANKGTLFLDEIGEMPLALQPKLLRVLQEHCIMPVGSNDSINLDIRVVSATNKDPKEMMEDGLFREDLYYRLNVVNLKVPPLRERVDDIPLLADFFIKKHSPHKKLALSPKALEHCLTYNWPGNIRELENAILRGIALTPSDIIELPSLIAGNNHTLQSIPKNAEELKQAKQKAREEMASQIEKTFIINALSRCQGNISKSAKETDMDRRQFQNMLRKHEIDADLYKLPEN